MPLKTVRSQRLMVVAAVLLFALLAQACSSDTAEQITDRTRGEAPTESTPEAEPDDTVDEEPLVDREGDPDADAGPDATPVPEPPRVEEAIAYFAPRPGAFLVSAGTTVAVRSGSTIDPASLTDSLISATGDISGAHDGVLLLADDDQTVIFEPSTPFADGEAVTVSIASGILTADGAMFEPTTYEFSVSPPLPEPEAPSQPPTAIVENDDQAQEETDRAVSPLGTAVTRGYQTIPETFPHMVATVTSDDAGEGFLFVNNHSRRPPNPVVLITEDNGDPVYYRELTPGLRHPDFKVLAPGLLSYYDWANGVYQIMDDSYRFVRTVQAGNGYQIDSHGIHLNDDGNVLVQIYDDRPFDMSQVVPGGLPDALVKGAVVQELDASGNVIFEWRSWDHFDVTDATSNIDLTSETPDVTHINSIEWDHTDGNIIISNRHMDEISKIDRQTGDVIWRMGGKNNQFTFIDEDRPFSHQHDARRLDNGNLTLYDNGNLNDPQYSRAVEYEIDEEALTATKVWEYRNQPEDIYGFATGGAQRLPNGNTVIAWGGAGVGGIRPIMTEVTAEGVKTAELHFISNESSYRVFREPWQGRPFEPPTLAVSGPGGGETLHYSWNGATNVEAFEVVAGATATPTDFVENQPKVAFETSSAAPALVTGPCVFHRVRAIDDAGTASAYSNPVFVGDDQCEQVVSLTGGSAEPVVMPSTADVPMVTATIDVPRGAIDPTEVEDAAFVFYADASIPLVAPDGELGETGIVFDLYGQVDGSVVRSLPVASTVAVALTFETDNDAFTSDHEVGVFGWDPGLQKWTAAGIEITEASNGQGMAFTTSRLTQFAVFTLSGQGVPRPAEDASAVDDESDQAADEGIELIQDGGFEGSAQGWVQTSSNVPNLICDGGCSYDGIPQSHSGNQWVFFGGGFTQTENASVSQQIAVPGDQVIESATMTFWLRMPDSGGTADEALSVTLDGQVLLVIDATQADDFREYNQVTVEFGDLLTGEHELSIDATVQPSSLSSFYIDDVSVTVKAAE